jgi:lysozyme family protein
MNEAMKKRIDELVGREGGYSNNPDDSGGETMWGITAAIARKNGYTGKMRDLPRNTAAEIYAKEFWTEPGFATVSEISPAVAEILFDWGVNSGPAVPAKSLQQWLNALNQKGQLYNDIAEDGGIGAQTIAAMNALYVRRGAPVAERALRRGLDASRTVFYLNISRANEKNETFLLGWLNRLDNLMKGL